LTGGEAHDVTAYDDLMDERDSDPGALLADKGYDSDAIRQDLRDRGATPEIPTKRNRLVQHSVDKALYALRSRIECCIGHLKEHRRVATCFDKTASSFLGFVMIACATLVQVCPQSLGSGSFFKKKCFLPFSWPTPKPAPKMPRK
jgi:transposase